MGASKVRGGPREALEGIGAFAPGHDAASCLRLEVFEKILGLARCHQLAEAVGPRSRGTDMETVIAWGWAAVGSLKESCHRCSGAERTNDIFSYSKRKKAHERE